MWVCACVPPSNSFRWYHHVLLRTNNHQHQQSLQQSVTVHLLQSSSHKTCHPICSGWFLCYTFFLNNAAPNVAAIADNVTKTNTYQACDFSNNINPTYRMINLGVLDIKSLPQWAVSWLLWSPRCSLGSPLQPVTSRVSAQTLSPEFFPGCRVLARREVDGLYHMGTVIQQVQVKRYEYTLYVTLYSMYGCTKQGCTTKWKWSPSRYKHKQANTDNYHHYRQNRMK